MEIDAQTVAAIVVASLGGAAGLRKLYLDWMKSRPEVASAAAVEEQFKAFRAQLSAQQQEIKELRAEVTRMDSTIHKQQTKVTRLEMLVRQFVGLSKEHGMPVPAFMQAELDDLFKDPEVQ